MKLRAGFVSNSSTASFIVQTRPTEWDLTIMDLRDEDIAAMTLSQEKIDILKERGFSPTKTNNPFLGKEFNAVMFGDPPPPDEGAFLGFWMTCNHYEAMQFLVAHDIPFKASCHYDQYLYSYAPKDEYVYKLQNFGMEYVNHPKKLEVMMLEGKPWMDIDPLRKISKEVFLEGYDEEDSIELMGDPLTRE
jgi:hypothetical protein